jgi:hypothetical protein
MQKWNDRLLECLSEGTNDLARETMVMVKKMRKKEALPNDFRKWAIVEQDDDNLLESVEKNLRRMLNTEEVWTLKTKSNGSAQEIG